MELLIFHAINHMGRPALDPIFIFLSNRDIWWVVAGILTLGVILKRDRRVWWAWLLVMVAVGISDALSAYVLKDLFQRPRPCHILHTVRLVIPCGNRFGFPSNHAANGMAVTVMAYLTFRSRWTWAFLVGTLLVGWSRIYLGVHYPTDVLGGYVVGAIVASFLYQLARFARIPFPSSA